MSSLEDARLNYVEQHVERLGMDAGRLEDARVAAARASPLGDTLDLCVRAVRPDTLEAIVPRLAQLVRAGERPRRASAAQC